ncbi:hypothetical protein OLCHANIL_00141 [Vibrio phage V05]|nr:hypothetical protein OLCHANIL_00141 [Vibrio phage V05]
MIRAQQVSLDIDQWLEYALQKFEDAKSQYLKAVATANAFSWKKEEPVLVKTFFMEYGGDSDPRYLLEFWSEVNAYIDEHTSDDWQFCSIEENEYDANDDPYEDYEMLSTSIAVYATVKGDDYTQSEEYRALKDDVDRCLEHLLECKENFKREFNK